VVSTQSTTRYKGKVFFFFFFFFLGCVLPIVRITLKTVFNRDLVSASYVIKSAVGASVVSSKISIARARADPMV
jgi:hypothetical protein